MSNHESRNSPRKIIIRQSTNELVKVDRVSTVSGILDRAIGIIDEQLTKLGAKSKAAGGMLDEKETRALHGHIKALVELSREEREREKADKTPDDLKGLTTDELMELAKKELGDIKATEPKKT